MSGESLEGLSDEDNFGSSSDGPLEDVLLDEQDFDKYEKEQLKPLNPTPLDPIQIDILKEVYQSMTSKFYKDESEKQIMDTLNDLRKFLDYEARRYRLYGAMQLIHRTIVLEDLDDVSVDDMLAYIDLMHYDIEERIYEGRSHIEIATYLYRLLRRRLEHFRELTYISQIFFGYSSDRSKLYENVPYFQTIPSPDPMKIKAKGANYYFLRVGELTSDSLMERFNFRELLNMVMIFGKMRWGDDDLRVQDHEENDTRWFLTNLTRKQDLARALVATVRDLNIDVRCYILLDGPESMILVEDDEFLVPINDDVDLDLEGLNRAMLTEGIPTTFGSPENMPVMKPAPLMYTEYAIAHLNPNFNGHYGTHRILQEAVVNERFSNGKLVNDEEEDDMVFYGKRDGFSTMIAYSLEELYNSFLYVNDFYDPNSIVRFPENPYLWVKFPKRSILRLIKTVLPNKVNSKWSDKLTMICQKIIATDDTTLEVKANKLYIETLMNVGPADENNLKKVFHRMYNVGLQFVGWDEQIARYDEESIAQLAMKDPLFVPEDINATGRIRAETLKLIMFIEETIGNMGDLQHYVNRLRIIRSYPPGFEPYDMDNEDTLPYYMTFDDEAYTVGALINVMYDMSRFGLSNMLQVSGLWLMTTANVYSKLITGVSLNAVTLDFDEVN